MILAVKGMCLVNGCNLYGLLIPSVSKRKTCWQSLSLQIGLVIRRPGWRGDGIAINRTEFEFARSKPRESKLFALLFSHYYEQDGGTFE